jgi:GNAT superfamily N-acetyltransferase
LGLFGAAAAAYRLCRERRNNWIREMTPEANAPSKIEISRIGHAVTRSELSACFPVISLLRPYLRGEDEWIESATEMAADGYRILAAWDGERVVAIAGYRFLRNLIHRRFLYVDDLVAAAGERGKGLGSKLLAELSAIALKENCWRLVLDTAATNT